MLERSALALQTLHFTASSVDSFLALPLLSACENLYKREQIGLAKRKL